MVRRSMDAVDVSSMLDFCELMHGSRALGLGVAKALYMMAFWGWEVRAHPENVLAGGGVTKALYMKACWGGGKFGRIHRTCWLEGGCFGAVSLVSRNCRVQQKSSVIVITLARSYRIDGIDVSDISVLVCIPTGVIWVVLKRIH
jgi:hypothetical protein